MCLVQLRRDDTIDEDIWVDWRRTMVRRDELRQLRDDRLH